MSTTRKHSKVVVRKGSLKESLYLTRGCSWTRQWGRAARYATQAAATAAAKRCGVGDNYGLFPTSKYPAR